MYCIFGYGLLPSPPQSLAGGAAKDGFLHIVIFLGSLAVDTPGNGHHEPQCKGNLCPTKIS